MASYRDTDAEKIKVRRWQEIRSEWRNYVPDHESPWPIPELEIFELESLREPLQNLGGPERRDSIIDYEIEGLREAALQESVVLVHKAANVIRAAAEEGTSGFRTWCRSSAYHAAFFAMRGVLGLLGVVVFRGQDRQSEYQVDLWAERGATSRLTQSQFATRIIRRRRRAEHKEMWGIFSRALRVTKIDDSIWPLLKDDPLKHVAPGKFSEVRHQIHYRSASWGWADINSLESRDDFHDLGSQVCDVANLAEQDSDRFPMCLAFYLISMGTALMADLGNVIPVMADEVHRLEVWMADTPWKVANAFDLIDGDNGT